MHLLAENAFTLILAKRLARSKTHKLVAWKIMWCSLEGTRLHAGNWRKEWTPGVITRDIRMPPTPCLCDRDLFGGFSVYLRRYDAVLWANAYGDIRNVCVPLWCHADDLIAAGTGLGEHGVPKAMFAKVTLTQHAYDTTLRYVRSCHAHGIHSPPKIETLK